MGQVGKHLSWRWRALTLAPALLVLVAAARRWVEVWGAGGFLHNAWPSPNQCEMSYSRPVYVPVGEIGGTQASSQSSSSSIFPPWYSLLLVADGRPPRKMGGPDKRPVLFVPGHLGSSKQARSLGRHLLLKDESLELFALDFGEELTAFHASLVVRQALFLLHSVARIRSLYSAGGDSQSAPPIVVVGHSYGGVVAKFATSISAYEKGSISDLLTLGTPMLPGACLGDHSMHQLYDRMSASGTSHLLSLGITLVSISGGTTDGFVTSSLCDAGVDDGVLSVNSYAIPGVGFGIDHKALLWCKQLLEKVSAALVAMRKIPSSDANQRIAAARSILIEDSWLPRLEGNFSSPGFDIDFVSDWGAISLSLVSDRAPLLIPAWFILGSLLLAFSLIFSSPFSPALGVKVLWETGSTVEFFGRRGAAALPYLAAGIMGLSAALIKRLGSSDRPLALKEALGESLRLPFAPFSGLVCLMGLTLGIMEFFWALCQILAYLTESLRSKRVHAKGRLSCLGLQVSILASSALIPAGSAALVYWTYEISPTGSLLLSYLILALILLGVLMSFILAPSPRTSVAMHQRMLLILYFPAVALSLGTICIAAEAVFQGLHHFDGSMELYQVIHSCALLFPIVCSALAARMGLVYFRPLEVKGVSVGALSAGARRSSHGMCSSCFHEDGGKDAIFVESNVDSKALGRDVYLGPGFRVVECKCEDPYSLCEFCCCTCTTCGGKNGAGQRISNGITSAPLKVGFGVLIILGIGFCATEFFATPYLCIEFLSALAVVLFCLSTNL